MMNLRRIIWNPITAAVLGVAATLLVTFLGIRSMTPPDRCKEVSSNIVFLESGNLITLGEEGVVCAYDLRSKKWVELAFNPTPEQTTPGQ